jgi:hypothetical protein
MVDHDGQAHSFKGQFDEHLRDDHDGGTPDQGLEDDKLYVPLKNGGDVAGQHFHLHRHGLSAPHAHWHDHDVGTLHVVMAELGSPPPLHEHFHRTPLRTALLLILGSSPMVEGIPAFFAAAKYGFGLVIVMATVFGMSTIATYVFLCVYSTKTLRRVHFGAVERYGEVLSGAFIGLVGLIFWIFPIA